MLGKKTITRHVDFCSSGYVKFSLVVLYDSTTNKFVVTATIEQTVTKRLPKVLSQRANGTELPLCCKEAINGIRSVGFFSWQWPVADFSKINYSSLDSIIQSINTDVEKSDRWLRNSLEESPLFSEPCVVIDEGFNDAMYGFKRDNAPSLFGIIDDRIVKAARAYGKGGYAKFKTPEARKATKDDIRAWCEQLRSYAITGNYLSAETWTRLYDVSPEVAAELRSTAGVFFPAMLVF